MSERRVAILRVTEELLHQVLLLPDDARITGVSAHQFFPTDGLAIRVECSAFPVVREWHLVPMVMAVYRLGHDGKPAFAGWDGMSEESA